MRHNLRRFNAGSGKLCLRIEPSTLAHPLNFQKQCERTSPLVEHC
jgi:hypothetical protein